MRYKFWSTLSLLTLGAITTFYSLNLDIGSLRAMGPGYFPMLLSILMMAMALVSLWRDTSQVNDGPVALGAVAAVILSLITFAVLIESLGLICAIAATVLIAKSADPGNTWRSSIALSTVTVMLTALVFKAILNIPINLW